MLFRSLARAIGSPFSFGILSAALFVCGLIAVGNLVAPELVEAYLPNWQTRFGTLITFGVVLGFIRSAWRLVVPIFALLFWIVALGAVFGGPLSSKLPSLQHLEERADAERSKVEQFFRTLPIPDDLRRLFR